MPFFGGPNECVIRTIHARDHGPEAGRCTFDQLLGSHVFLVGRLQHLDAMLVGSGEEENVIAIEPLEPGDRGSCDGLVGMADVGRAIRVRNGRGDVVAGSVGHFWNYFWNYFWNSWASRNCGYGYQPRAVSASQPNTRNTNGL